ncbi:MAG: hypothetical protein KC643_30690 [Nitrospira sp.]|nr:hypothetical protein [Nitrospira sp.]MCA9500887.1 hypothetical protein [Nitrospira sp.]MDR4486002.1 hypothetical protein [Nitrospirales bacterium]
MAIVIPSYIEKAGVMGAPLDFVWKGALDHIGPVETVNKMFNLIGYKTTCGILTQAAGIISWGAWRLKGHTDVSVLLQMIEASFAFQVHPHYVNRNGVDTWEPKDEPAAKSAADELQVLLWEGLNTKKWWNDYYQPFDSAFHSAYLVRHIMPKNKKKVFSKWLEAILARIKEIAPKPDEEPVEDEDVLTPEELAAYYARHWGAALPPEVLDLEYDYQPSKREELVDRFLHQLDWRENPFLRSPEAIKKMGFKGTPYKLF